ncbi:hypothetical protein [Hansschlegelia zhihuaiae]|uniref:Uncharacterized protein n=1 Tax=Hansschlegelia zhihuaiae TaxID=405005 RepID=A0A4Q0MPP1_9HYPH|nr:hypothetical protein [Hansschlegelia zhihuaiae]RXF75615.1 hypothetical protein EK403_01885 [Hansschlegelia zhihuaiae]
MIRRLAGLAATVALALGAAAAAGAAARPAPGPDSAQDRDVEVRGRRLHVVVLELVADGAPGRRQIGRSPNFWMIFDQQ